MSKSAIKYVLSQEEVVVPAKGTPLQPGYVRSKRSVQTSSRLREFQSCVASKLAGQHFGDRMAVRNAFKSAASSCK